MLCLSVNWQRNVAPVPMLISVQAQLHMSASPAR